MYAVRTEGLVSEDPPVLLNRWHDKKLHNLQGCKNPDIV